MRRIGVLLAALALPLFALPPAPAKYVTDAAGVLDDAREEALNERLARYDRETTNQLLVYVDRHGPALVIGMGVIVGGGSLIFLFVLFGLALRHRRETGRWFPRSSGSSWRSGGSSSSSTFRGGGGSGGGGGASDRW
jgi:uncharacterized membrane protein YgcG